MEEPIAHKNEHGTWIYNRLPEGMRVATRDDFFDEDKEIILNKPFLARSFHYPRYEAHSTKLNFMEKWEYWLLNNHIFIRSGNPSSSSPSSTNSL